jgi:hypothetical protein
MSPEAPKTPNRIDDLVAQIEQLTAAERQTLLARIALTSPAEKRRRLSRRLVMLPPTATLDDEPDEVDPGQGRRVAEVRFIAGKGPNPYRRPSIDEDE